MRRRHLFAAVVCTPTLAVAIAAASLAVVGGASAAEERAQQEWNEAHAPSPFEICAVLAMRHHHEQAIELSGILVAVNDTRPDLRSYAEFIADAQRTEIATMDAWVAAWDEVAPSAAVAPVHHGAEARGATADPSATTGRTCDSAATAGMATPEQIRALAESTGDESARLFVDLMIAHHEGAVTMSRQVLAQAENPYVLSSAGHTVTEQSLEIDQLRELRP